MSKRGMRSSLHLALAKIGRSNGHGPPAGCSNVDAIVHNYFIDSEAKSFFETQRKKSLGEMLGVISDDATARIDELIAAAEEENRKQPTTMLHESENYVVNLDVKKPAERLDATALRNKLVRDGKYTVREINAMFDECTKQNAPAKTFTVSVGWD